MPTLLFASALTVITWAASGALGYLWYKRLEKNQDSQVPERTLFLLLGPVGLCMLFICTTMQSLQNLCRYLYTRV